MTVATAPAGDPPALCRLEHLEQRFPERFTPVRGVLRPRQPAPSVPVPASSMGYQPGLDGIRALSVLAVIGYHAGISWLPGGFFGVEVFFVVSGFLITSLLLEERGSTGSVSLRNFWLRRARRLFPALAAMLAAVATWAVFAGSSEQLSQLRRDLPWSIFYAGNWGQILGDVPYYSGEPPLLRHVWSLAVEEQWYLLWPLAFVALTTAWSRARCAKVVAVAALASMLLMAWLSFGDGPIRSPIGLFDGIDRVNFTYLATPTRASGLLLGAAVAFVWRPWRRGRQPGSTAGARALDRVGAVAIAVLVGAVAFGHLQEPYVYRWLLPLVTVSSLALTAIVVVPGEGRLRAVMSWRPLVEVGKRSYGLYLWHWPIFVITDATDGSLARLLPALALTVVVSELCYRFVETPVRRGALGRWWRRTDRARFAAVGASCFLAVALVAYYVDVRTYDAAAGGGSETFTVPADGSDAAGAPALDPSEPAGVPGTEAPGPMAPPSTAAASPELPVSLSIVGDSQAHSLAINLPDGIESTFTVSDASLDGCSVYDRGGVVSSRDVDSDFGICAGWQERWATAGANSDVVLVVLGAWDVFDLELDGTVLPFASPEWDAAFTGAVQEGIDAIASGGARAALLEVSCMRPIDIDGAGVPALPERGDDGRVAHVNELLRALAATNEGTASFVEGPDQFCTGREATDTGYRWDGVHVYVPGANLVYETITPALLGLA